MTSSHPAEDGRDAPASLPPLFSIGSSDPHQELVDRSGLDEQDIAQIDALMGALARLLAAERELAEASRRFMQLGETDMRALHLLIVCENTGTLATPGTIAQALEISTASTTKLLDRLERAGHVHRAPHPSDRRALVITIDPATRASAARTIGAQHARRVDAAKRLERQERDVVIRFLEDMAAEIAVDGLEWEPPAPR